MKLKIGNYRIVAQKRTDTSRLNTFLAQVLALILALSIAALIFLINNIDPFFAYQKIFEGLGTTYGLSEAVVKAIPLMLCALGLAFSYKALVWNIGAEGQLLLGATAASWVALFFQDLPPFAMLPTMFLAGFAGGALWGLVPAIAKAKSKTNLIEVLTTLMLNYIAIQVVNYLVYGPWRGAEQWGFPFSEKFPDSAIIPKLLDTRIHYPTLLIALFSSVALYFILTRTTIGYDIRVIGENPDAAKYAKINYFRTVLLVMLIGGGLAGLAGVGEIAGTHNRFLYPKGISPGYGYTAIIVAWLGRLNPLLIVFASLLVGGLLVGGDAIQISLRLPASTIDIFNGLILFSVLIGDRLARYKISLKREE